MVNKVLIYKDNLINNIKQVKSENPNSKVCAIVKANAYGVGSNEVVQILNDYVQFFGVSCFFEAKKIQTLTNKSILILGPVDKENIEDGFSYTCGTREDAEFLINLNQPIKIHLKINTGMNRYGFKCLKEFKKVLSLIKKSKLIVEGIYTHFATTDDFVHTQMKEFSKFVKLCFDFGFNPIVHADNSFVNEKYNHCLNMVRIGFSLYCRDEGWFLPAIEIKSEIVNIVDIKKGEIVGYDYRFVAKRKMRVAIIPIGYADGFKLKFIGMCLKVDGVDCKILNVCMDCFMLDVSDVNVKKGDEIFILNKFNSLKSYANFIETSPYEIATNFSSVRADRIII